MRTSFRSGLTLSFLTCTIASLANPAAQGAIVHRWSFNDATANDSIGSANGTAAHNGSNAGATVGGPTFAGGGVLLDGIDDYVITSPIDAAIGVRTMIAWVTLDNLAQRSGSALTLGNMNGVGDVFDGIVYGERLAGQWMNGSNGWSRSVVNNGGLAETSLGEVMIAITFDGANQITLYRNGIVYATAANASQGTLQTYNTTQGIALLGVRHEDLAGGSGSVAGNDAFLAGFINEARIYNLALSEERILELYNLGPDLLVAPPVLPTVPEPGTWALLGLATIGFASRTLRTRRN